MTGTPEWMADAACRGIDPRLMVPREPTRGRPEDKNRYQRDVNQARVVCAGCPVIKPCLDWAIRHREVGVWGGTTEQERRRIRRRERVASEWDASVIALFDRIAAEIA